ncbi:glycosyltransferase family 4 protein [Puniceicoccaceae bacterium K14]|nr:glycosyltransferase family 4 protein [Puniceicoccaceae bacterium K14]
MNLKKEIDYGESTGMRLAVVLSHPTQYYSPWFRELSMRVELKVFYLWDFGVRETVDRTFKKSFTWDIPLLDGYDYQFVENHSKDPGTHHFKGLDNPQIVEVVSNWQPDTLLMFGYNYATHIRLIFSPRLRGITFWFRGDSHELCPSTGWRTRIRRYLRVMLFYRFHRFLAVGAANCDYFEKSGVDKRKIALVSHCIDNARFRSKQVDLEAEAMSWKQELGIPEGAVVILFAGKFEEKKRPSDLLKSFVIVKDRLMRRGGNCKRNFVLLFVGSGKLEASLKEEAGTGLGEDVFFAPFQNQSRMPLVYAMGALFVLPSYGRGETWGLAVNEAMNLGKPVIVSSHVGCSMDLIVDGRTGWVFEAGNLEALCERLQTALADVENLQKMGMHAKNHIEKFSYENSTAAVVNLLSQKTLEAGKQ